MVSASDPAVERFAPSPTGELHLGHAFSALTAWEAAQAAGGTFLLRMDDLDTGRCRPKFARCIEEDLRFLGLTWPEPVLYQSTRAKSHCAVIDDLADKGLVYGCVCTRAEIQAAAGAPQEGAPDGPPYPGTCRERSEVPSDKAHALRLDMKKAIDFLGGPDAVRALSFEEIGEGPRGEHGMIPLDPQMLIEQVGDVVLRRKDGAIAYHLGVVLDDGFQGVTHVTRGQDLFPSTPIHRLLQALTGTPTPVYRHHRLIRDENGRRLAKRHKDLSLAVLRESGATPEDIRSSVGLAPAGQSAG
ncbi:Glutamate--tRNA ligase [Methyloligella halotolerans]|uniref:Glutamate--tRNA ligase n=1 Tax=Methyloligella halotolerans TaxID=1177755 RepID=A0A1E2RWX4_9HYPH|nr:tRNA glutamyl-Q(34) synthetase GluQRS [Methyloligella halotolerans]ODA66734.1 Glutamate--tRNA ligase [Methyloligella halotolerans]